MPQIDANGITINYEETGAAADPAILLVSGFGSQLTTWPDSFKRTLADAGRRVIVFDNRDVGLTTELTEHTPPSPRDVVKAVAAGEPAHEQVPYVLNDMAADAAGLLDALSIAQADAMGVSMGGMIVQLLALNHPEKVRKLIPVMTTSGDPTLPPGEPAAMEALTAIPASRTADAIGDLAVQSRRAIGSHDDLRNPDDVVRAKAMSDFERSDRPFGVARQYAAILAQPRWHERLGQVSHPTLVLHGEIDPLIKAEAGKDVARRIPGAELQIIEKWGHDLPDVMVADLAKRVLAFLDA